MNKQALTHLVTRTSVPQRSNSPAAEYWEMYQHFCYTLIDELRHSNQRSLQHTSGSDPRFPSANDW
jgi:hypothetical protein